MTDVAWVLAQYEAGRRDFRNCNFFTQYGIVHDFSGAPLSGINFNGVALQRACFVETNLRGADFGDTILYGADFSEANLSRADLSLAALGRAKLSEANLYRATLYRANLVQTDLRGANLSLANLNEADLLGVNLNGANLRGTTMCRADLRWAKLAEANLDAADLTDAAFANDADLLSALWETIIFGDEVYSREKVEQGEQLLPLAMGDPLRFVFAATRRLTGGELEAASQLAEAFGSVTAATRIAFELSNLGQRLVIESRVSPKEASHVALAVLRAQHATRQRQQQLLAGQQTLLDQVVQVREQNHLLQFDASILRLKLEELLSALALDEIQFPDVKSAEEAATDVQLLAAERMEHSGRKFLKRLRRAPESAALAVGAAAEALGVPAGFDAGAALAMAIAAGQRRRDNGDDKE